MKELVSTVTERGQVSIPASVRKRLSLKPGQKLVWQTVSPQECLVIVRQDTPAVGARAMIGFAATFRKTRRTAEWMKELREGEND